ncbi:uncharacterized protein VTP21DRAFT_4010 [Calcarisporiella thermophila]|uniref:uncharacterized protein n=1 Tax=Calcarisporiella thermophila TaxID=911321 RepID=UPI0037446A42
MINSHSRFSTPLQEQLLSKNDQGYPLHFVRRLLLGTCPRLFCLPGPAEQLENSAEIDKRFIGWGFPTVLNSAYYANSANVKDRFHHHANLAANVKANEATKAANHANVYNIANTNAVVHKRQVASYLGLGGIAGGLSSAIGVSALAGVSPLTAGLPYASGLQYASGIPLASRLQYGLPYTTGFGAIGTPYI